MKCILLNAWMLLITFPMIGQKVTVEGEVSMLALGDSYTIGESVEINERWPHQLISQLRTLGVSGDFPDYVATTGWTTRNLLNGIQTKLSDEKEYNLVSILIGVNNQYQGMDIAAYEPDLRKIIDSALEIVDQDSSRLMILSIPDYAYTPFGRENPTISQEIDEYNDIKRSVADEYGITFIDITGISREGLDTPSLVASDGLHPSNEQYARWVEAIIPKLNLKKSLSLKKKEQPGQGSFHLYPNPAVSQIHVDTSLDMKRIRIYNSLGKMVLDLGITSLPARIDLSRFETGAYTLCAYPESDTEILCRSLIINQ